MPDVLMFGETTPSDNADMSNEKGISPRLKLMEFILIAAPKLYCPKGINDG
jgi:hypothetical protein